MADFRFFKSVLFSRTVWCIFGMLTAALVGINASSLQFTNFSLIQVKMMMSLAVVVLAVLGVMFRIKANHRIITTPMDRIGGGLYAAPLIIGIILATPGCSYMTNAELSSLDKAKITVSTINDMYIPARTAYETFYRTASDDMKAKLEKSLNGRVNAATALMISLTDMTVAWETTQTEPKEFSESLDKAKRNIPPLVMDIGAAVTPKKTEGEANE